MKMKIKLNSEFKFLLYAHLVLAIFLIYELFDLITLLYDDSYRYAFLPNELNNENYIQQQPQLIPKIIHQTYKTTDIPEHWKDGQKNCQILNPDYKYILWTDEMARDFIAEQYPWFLKTFDSYPFPIERADAIRYFILYHFGGIYIDLDDSCQRNLDPLLTVPAFVRKTLPTGISNDLLGSVPNHPFFYKAINQLEKYQRNWLVPYITIMFSTGPLFLSVVWKQYIRWGNPPSGIVRILMPDDYKNASNAFFKITKGSSWHEDDAAVLLLMAKHIVLSVIFCTLLGIAIIASEYFFIVWFHKHFSPKIVKLSRSLKNYLLEFTPLRTRTDYTLLNGDYRNRIPRKARKDSNLPVAISVDLEKNVTALDSIDES
ncbi:uncharacterized protein C5L36_0B12270 [Pichia kudriavzevii]|uniref:inositol phosphorylceramide mannosyltransferase n=1 Tax=Pichia kudriavzevii TaxID=4909 RepID=A0A099P454_PICKU|nr:uncharacterized protein C5L36_0B12270 [Pichia kudriavzevii]AWU75998.1 hypothetical protein C5L36_0B12270 [Pichia kudriavzevii]KGK38982.1 hypothetical protein JL09_g1840 [Pichia kudriavzevii]ONH71875.1 Mannosyl phosphorylinositol ceramide synthase CSH1 [Pichia kudriavzevii]